MTILETVYARDADIYFACYVIVLYLYDLCVHLCVYQLHSSKTVTDWVVVNICTLCSRSLFCFNGVIMLFLYTVNYVLIVTAG